MADKNALKNQTKNIVEQKKNTDAFIKQNITVLPELQNLIPPLSTDEMALLEQNILKEGCRESLILWKKDDDTHILIDGHNRFYLCKKNNLDFNIKVLDSFADIETVKDWMIDNQLGKRNVTDETKSYLRGLQYNREKQKQGGDRKSSGHSDHLIGLKTHEKLAEQHKVAPKTIQRDEVFAIALDTMVGDNSELKWKILNREIVIPKSSLEKVAKESPEILETLRENITKTNSFEEAVVLTFPQENKPTANLQQKQLVKKLEKALHNKNKEEIDVLITDLQNLTKEW
jgi:hypothetical protein